MKKLWLTIGLIAFVSVLVTLALVQMAGTPREPEYDGKGLISWLNDLDYDPSLTRRMNPRSAILGMGTNAVPFLAQMLHAKDSPLKRAWITLLRRQHWVDFHVHYDFQRRHQAIQALLILGPDAKAAAPDLADLLNGGNGSDGLMAAIALARIGPPAIPALAAALTNSNDHVRQDAVQALGFAREPSCVPHLLAALNDPSWIIRGSTAIALQYFPEQANIIVPALIKCLDDPNPDVQRVTAKTIGSFGERAKFAVPQILKIIDENKGNTALVEELDNALSNIDPDAAAKLNGK